MSRRIEHLRRASAAAALLALTACGGGGSDSAAVAVQPPVAASAPTSTTTNVNTTVVDGAIKNALVCVDKNGNGLCDVGETQGSTDASGNVTLAVPNADLGKYALVAMVGTDAIDADHGPVTTAYSMSAPADQAAVVSPLTTLVQQTVASTGASSAEAAASVQAATGITASLFQDFTKVTAPSDGSVSAAGVARMLIVTTQQQTSAIASTLGKPAVDGVAITQVHLDKAIQKKLLELLPALVTALSNPAVLAATSPADKEAALLTAAAALVTSAGLTPAAVATVVAINSQNAKPTPVVVAEPVASLNLDTLNFASLSNYFVRTLGGSVAQNTLDVSNNVKYVERRTRSIAGNVAQWGAGSDPARNADLSWNGSAWVGCPINFENTSGLRDAQGNSSYSYCGRETGKTSRATFDIGGKTLASVYAQIVAAGYNNFSIADPTLLGTTAVFPVGASLAYQTNTALTAAVSYYPAGANSAPATSNVVYQASAAVAAGGIASAQAAGVACNAAEALAAGTLSANSTTLEGMIAAKPGTPCIYVQDRITYNGVSYLGDASTEAWGHTTWGLGTIGTASTTPSASSTGLYTGNTRLQMAFKGTGANPVTYYACKQRFVNGAARNCTVIGTGSYTIATLGDARVMTLNNLPLLAATLTSNRVFVERGGVVYSGYQNKPTVSNKARLNRVAAGALLSQLGLTVDDPALPLALTAGSYQGIWDLRRITQPVTGGISFFINGNGSVSCQDRSDSTYFPCAVSITNASTGAFSFSNNSGDTATGNLDFQTGTATGVEHDATATPVDANVVGTRR
jgi:hypothetical protein